MSDERPASPEKSARHAARLDVTKFKKDKIRYAATALFEETGKAPSRQAVSEWLVVYGVLESAGESRSQVSNHLSEWRRERGLEDTGQQTTITPELIEAMDERTGRVVRFPGTTEQPVNSGSEQQNTRSEQRLNTPAEQPTGETEQQNTAGPVASEQQNTPRRGSEQRQRPTDQASLVTRYLRFGWQKWAGLALAGFGVLVGMAAVSGVGMLRLFDRALISGADWRVFVIAAGAGALIVVTGVVLFGRAPKRQVRVRPLSAPARAWYVMFALALGASADASFRVWHDVLKVPAWEAVAFFAVIEVGLLAAGLSMRSHLLKHGTPGPARSLVWLLTGFGVVAALLVSGFPHGLWRAVGGPLAAVLALHMALGVELRAEGAREQLSRFRQAIRSLGEYMLSYVGAGTGDQTWIMIRHERAVARAARLASVSNPSAFTRWRYVRAYRACGAGRDESGSADFMKALAAYRATGAVWTMPTVSPWDNRTLITAPMVERQQQRDAAAARCAAKKSKSSSDEK